MMVILQKKFHRLERSAADIVFCGTLFLSIFQPACRTKTVKILQFLSAPGTGFYGLLTRDLKVPPLGGCDVDTFQRRSIILHSVSIADL